MQIRGRNSDKMNLVADIVANCDGKKLKPFKMNKFNMWKIFISTYIKNKIVHKERVNYVYMYIDNSKKVKYKHLCA